MGSVLIYLFEDSTGKFIGDDIEKVRECVGKDKKERKENIEK